MQTNPAVKQNKNIKWSESLWNQSVNILPEMYLWTKKSPLILQVIRSGFWIPNSIFGLDPPWWSTRYALCEWCSIVTTHGE